MSQNNGKTINAVFKELNTNYSIRFDCTPQILKLSLEDIRALVEGDMLADELVPEEVFQKAEVAFKKAYEGKALPEFLFRVDELKSEILKYFVVQESNQIRKCKICGQLEGESGMRDHLEAHNPNWKLTILMLVGWM